MSTTLVTIIRTPKAVDSIFEYPGTICEWPEDGPGSGCGPNGVFACKHCGRGHNEHGSGDNALAEKLGVSSEMQHRICKVPRYLRMTDDLDQLGYNDAYRARHALKLWRQQELAIDNKPGTLETCLGQARYCRLEDTIEWKICGGAAVRRKVTDIERSAKIAVIKVGSSSMDPERNEINDGIAPYYTIVIPFVPRGAWEDLATKWHPTEETGPMSTLTRGAFKTWGEAYVWARENLNGTPYTIKLIKE